MLVEVFLSVEPMLLGFRSQFLHYLSIPNKLSFTQMASIRKIVPFLMRFLEVMPLWAGNSYALRVYRAKLTATVTLLSPEVVIRRQGSFWGIHSFMNFEL